jgi:hypothetical protein
MPTGLGDEQLWLSATNDNTGSSTAFDDLSGNGNDGTANGGMLVVADTSEGGSYAYDFDGTNDQIDLPSSIQSALGTVEQSFAFWMNRDVATANHGLIGLGTNASRQMWVFGSFVNDVYYDGASTGSPTTGTWQHVAGTIDGTNTRIYVDGVLVSTVSATQPIPSGSATANYIGYIDGYGRYNGKLDDVRIYNRTLTQAEITHLASSRGVEGPPPVGLGDEQLWLCPSLSGENTSDLSGNGNVTTLLGNIAYTANTDEGGTLCFEGTGLSGINGLQVPSSASTDLTGSTTYSMWVQSHTLGSTDYILATRSTNNQNMFDLASTTSGVRHRINSGASTTFVQSGLLTVNTWHHLVLTRDGDDWELFVDGVSGATGTGTLGSYTQDFTMLMQNTVGNSCWDGYLDDFRQYSRVITQAEITHLASSRGVEGPAPVGLGDEQLWFSATLNSQGNSLGEVTIPLEAGGTASIGSLDTSNSSFLSPNGSNKWSTGNGYISGDPSKCSIAFWYKADLVGGVSGLGGLGTSSYNGTTLGLVKANTNAIRVYYGGNGSNLNVDSGTQYGQGLVHFAVTYDVGNSQISYYRNGVLVKQTSVSLSNLNFGTGKSFSTGIEWAGFTNAHLEDIRVYERILTADEIAWLAVAPNLEGPPPVGLGDEQLWLCPSLNDSANDISGNGNDGTYAGGMTTTANTGSGGSRAYNHDTTARGITCPADLGITGDSHSISIWVNNSQTSGSGVRAWFGAWDGTSDSNMMTYQYKNDLRAVDTNTGGGTTLGVGNPSAPINTWKHIVVVADSAAYKYRFYQDGVLVEEVNGVGTMDVQTVLPWCIGKSPARNSALGMSDDARVYGRALTQAEITHLASSRGVEGSPSTPTTQYNAFATHAFKQLFQTRLR